MSRLTTAAFLGVSVAAWTAVPDYVDAASGRRVARLACLAVMCGGWAPIVRPNEPPGADPAEELPDALVGLRERVPESWWPAAPIAAGVALLGAGYGINRAWDVALERLAGRLGRRGVPVPNTLLGLLLGAACGALEYADDRW